VPKPSKAQRYGTTIKGVCAAFEIILAANRVPSEKITKIVVLLGYDSRGVIVCFIEFDVGFNICLISVPFVYGLPIMVRQLFPMLA
jgi:hypothetical protein